MNTHDVDQVRVLRAGDRTIVHVPGGRGEELRVHLESHGILSRVEESSQAPYERLEVQDADEEVLRAVVSQWEG